MYAPKQADPKSQQAIAAYLAAGGEVKRCSPSAHGTCEMRKGINFRGSKADNPIDHERLDLEARSPRARMSDPNVECPRGGM